MSLSDAEKSRFLPRLAALAALLALAIASLVPTPASAAYSTSVSGANTTLTFGYEGSIETFTVPDNVSEITISLAGGEGGQGGDDSPGRAPREGYKGVVTGTVPVSAGQIISVAVGARGVKPDVTTGTGSGYTFPSLDPRAADGGANPVAGKYAGGSGGAPGPNGSSGYGGSGGAATLVMIGTGADPDANGTIVAGGAGGSGGSGNGTALRGQIGKDSFLARSDDGTDTNGQIGVYARNACNDASQDGCDGGGGAGGGGGATGGSQGVLEYGAAGVSEWFGHGGYPGANATADYPGLTASYNAYTFASDDNQINGFVTITYSAGTPGSPTGVAGTVGDGQIDLYWTAPASVASLPFQTMS